jgi:REP element-mobilizing transposase RayT
VSPRWEPNPDIRRGRSVVYTLHAHLVFTPKYRRGVFTGHIHRFLWGDHFWSPSYFAASVGGAPLCVVKEYIENQKRPD